MPENHRPSEIPAEGKILQIGRFKIDHLAATAVEDASSSGLLLGEVKTIVELEWDSIGPYAKLVPGDRLVYLEDLVPIEEFVDQEHPEDAPNPEINEEFGDIVDLDPLLRLLDAETASWVCEGAPTSAGPEKTAQAHREPDGGVATLPREPQEGDVAHDPENILIVEDGDGDRMMVRYFVYDSEEHGKEGVFRFITEGGRGVDLTFRQLPQLGAWFKTRTDAFREARRREQQ